MIERIQVEGHPDLYRDPSTGAIINSNIDEYNAYMEAKRKREELYNSINEINNLKEEMAEIKSLLKELINRNGN